LCSAIVWDVTVASGPRLAKGFPTDGVPPGPLQEIAAAPFQEQEAGLKARTTSAVWRG
jgi:hypothetical protein